jgi:hypothetical protein
LNPDPDPYLDPDSLEMLDPELRKKYVIPVPCTTKSYLYITHITIVYIQKKSMPSEASVSLEIIYDGLSYC